MNQTPKTIAPIAMMYGSADAIIPRKANIRIPPISPPPLELLLLLAISITRMYYDKLAFH
jgi:hypothetical protein